MRSDKRKEANKKRKLYVIIAIIAVLVIIAASVFFHSDNPSSSDPAQSGEGQVSQGDDSKSGESGSETGSESGSGTDSETGGEFDGEDSNGSDVSHPSYTPSKEIRTEDDGNLLVLVNKEFAVSRNYAPTDMVDIDGSLSTNQNLQVKREAYDAYLKMYADAQKEGLNFAICSAYRSYELQETLYNDSLAANGQEYTEKMFAYPGKSEHHTGYAIDVTSASMNWGLSQNFTDYPDGAWITEHCSEYGFIIRYPEGKEDITGYMYEPWHIRYVGVEVAQYITEQGITFEEYLGVA